MTHETAAIASARADSLRKRLELLYLRAAEVEVRCPVEELGKDGEVELVDGTETLHLEAPKGRDEYRMSLDFYSANREKIDSLAGFEMANRDADDLDPDEREKLLSVMELNLALAVEHVRLACVELRDADRDLIAAIIRGNGGTDGDLASQAARVCAAEGQGFNKGGTLRHDPFASPSPAG